MAISFDATLRTLQKSFAALRACSEWLLLGAPTGTFSRVGHHRPVKRIALESSIVSFAGFGSHGISIFTVAENLASATTPDDQRVEWMVIVLGVFRMLAILIIRSLVEDMKFPFASL